VWAHSSDRSGCCGVKYRTDDGNDNTENHEATGTDATRSTELSERYTKWASLHGPGRCDGTRLRPDGHEDSDQLRNEDGRLQSGCDESDRPNSTTARCRESIWIAHHDRQRHLGPHKWRNCEGRFR